MKPSDYHPYMEEIVGGEPEQIHAIYELMRAESPVHYIEEFDAWFLFLFEDIWQCAQDSEHVSMLEGNTPGHLLVKDLPRSISFTSMDPPQHTRYRSQVNRHFLPGAARKLEATLRGFARGFVDEFIEKGEADLVRDFALRLSVRGASTVGGLPIEEADLMAGWVQGVFDRKPGHRGTTEVGAEASKQMFFFLLDHVKAMRKNPDKATGVLRTLLESEVEGRRLDDFHIASTLSLVLIGGTDTFPKALGATFHRLWQHPDQRAEVRANKGLARAAFLEALRLDTPTQMLGRNVVASFEIRGRALQPNQKVMFMFASANRDEREFERADAYDLHRSAPRMLAFGHGVHMCLGKQVALMEAQVGIEEVLARLPEYEIDEGAASRVYTEFVKGWRKLPVSFPPARSGASA